MLRAKMYPILLASTFIFILALVLFALTLLVQPELLNSPALLLILAGLAITGAGGFLANLKDVIELVGMIRSNHFQESNNEDINQELFSLLKKHFDAKELRELAFLSGIDHENLEGKTKNVRLISLIEYTERHVLYEELIKSIKDLRPDLEEKIDKLTEKEEAKTSLSKPEEKIEKLTEKEEQLPTNKAKTLLLKPTVWVIGAILLLVLFGIISVINSGLIYSTVSVELTPVKSATLENNQNSTLENELVSIPQSSPAPTAVELDQENVELNNNEYIPERITDSGFEFVLVPEGVFEGSVDYPFYINTYEVSNRQFVNFLNTWSNKCSQGIDCIDLGETAARITRKSGQYIPEPGYEEYPVVEVTWYGANDYCNWIGGRLPSNSEWRKAATWHPISGEVFSYPWGNEPNASDFANVDGNALTPVGSFEQGISVVGAYNMFGNVWEFSSIEQGSQRLWYGGSWKSLTVDAFSMNSGEGRNSTHDDLGFRCVKDVN